MNKNPFSILFPLCIFLYLPSACNGTSKPPSSQSSIALDSLLTPIAEINAAIADHDKGIVVTIKGTVTALLPDDVKGKKHQRFIVRLSSGQTLLIAHNIDIAPRVAGIKDGSVVYIHGEYEWNNKGGVVHWTHRDPGGVHENGWIVFGSVTYQ